MFCTSCGAKITDGSTLCNACGAAVTPPPASVPSAVPLKKGAFIATAAPARIRVFSVISMLLALACIALMVGAYHAVLKTSFENIPLVRALAEGEENLKDITSLKDEIKSAAEKYKSLLKGNEDMFTPEAASALSSLLELAEDLGETLSFHNLSRAVDGILEMEQMEFGFELDLREEMEEIKEARRALNGVLLIIKWVLLVLIAFALLFTVFGGFFRIRGLVITGVIFSMLFTLTFCSAIFTIAAAVLHLAMIVFLTLIHSAYRRYRKSFSVQA